MVDRTAENMIPKLASYKCGIAFHIQRVQGLGLIRYTILVGNWPYYFFYMVNSDALWVE